MCFQMEFDSFAVGHFHSGSKENSKIIRKKIYMQEKRLILTRELTNLSLHVGRQP